jgi:hypothetical protein
MECGQERVEEATPVPEPIPVVIPEPRTILLLGSSLIALAGFRRKFKR